MLLQHLFGDSIPMELKDLEMPDPYGLKSLRICKDETEILGSPVFVSEILSVYERSSSVCSTSFNLVAFIYGSDWVNFEVSSADLFDSKRITRILAEYGVLVTSNTARSVVKYFQVFVQANLGMLPRIKKFKFTGWNRERFLLPNSDLDVVVDSGLVCNYLENSGDLKVLAPIIRKAWNYPGVRLLLDLSLSPVLLKVCGVRNFVVNFYGRSGGGKTAALRLASALWGSPMFMNEFNATVNSIESFGLERNDLPTFMNEWQVTDKSNRKQISNSIVHRFGEGRSKARLNKNSELQIVKEFRSIMICTAEEPLVNSESIQGVRARCMDLEFTPVIGTLCQSKMFVDLDLCSQIYAVTQNNYGYFGRDFVKRIISEKRSSDLFSEYTRFYESILGLRPDLLPAHAQYMALISMVDCRFTKYYIDPSLSDEEVESSWLGWLGKIISKLPSKDSQIDSERAFELSIDWLIENQSKFILSPLAGIPSPYYGFRKNDTWYVIPRVLRDFLFSEGFDSVKIFSEWYRAGLIGYDKSQQTYGVRVTDYQGRRKIYIGLCLKDPTNPTSSPNQ